MNKTTITLTAALAGLLLLTSGAAIGAAIRQRGYDGESHSLQPEARVGSL